MRAVQSRSALRSRIDVETVHRRILLLLVGNRRTSSPISGYSPGTRTPFAHCRSGGAWEPMLEGCIGPWACMKQKFRIVGFDPVPGCSEPACRDNLRPLPTEFIGRQVRAYSAVGGGCHVRSGLRQSRDFDVVPNITDLEQRVFKLPGCKTQNPRYQGLPPGHPLQYKPGHKTRI